MKIIAINGSPRKNWNTDILLNQALEGAKIEGADVELIDLYNLDYKGCRSCLECKRINNKHKGHCVIKDDLKPVLEAIEKADGIIIGTPIYFSEVTGQVRAFLERLWFQYLNYEGPTFFTGKLKVAFIYTLNAPSGTYDDLFKRYEKMSNRFFTYVGMVESSETLQVERYDHYHLGLFDGDARHQRRNNEFISDCTNAYRLGRLIAKND